MRGRLLALAFAIVLALSLAEGGARYLEARSDRATNARRIPDAVLGRTMPASQYGHDARGFRNAQALERADVVVLGDSQSWGVNVQRPQNWPSQFADLTSQTVYNMALPGFGPAQYWALTPKALALQPSRLIVQLYLGNDWLDAYEATYRLDHYAAWRQAPAPPVPSDAVNDPREQDWIGGRLGAPWSQSALARMLFGLRSLSRGVEASTRAGVITSGAGGTVSAIASAEPSAHLDLSDPAITEGARLTLAYLDAIRGLAADRLVVLVFPAKALVYADHRTAELTEREDTARRQILAWCDRQRVRCVDPLPAFRAALAQGTALYLPTVERHPIAAGYRLIGQAVAGAK